MALLVAIALIGATQSKAAFPTLNALLAYLDEQKLSKCRMSVEELFAANISPGLADYLRATGEAYAVRNGDGASTRSQLATLPLS